LRRFKLLGKASYEGVKPVVEIPYIFPCFSFAVVALITHGLVISRFIESFGECFMKEVPICDFPWGNFVKPILGPFNKSIRETFHQDILMLVTIFYTMHEYIQVILWFNKVFP